MTVRRIEQMWTDKIEEVGVTKRIFFHCLIVFDDDTKQWHYFGTTQAEAPPTTTDPVFEYEYVMFPRDLDELRDAEIQLYKLGLQAGLQREGLYH